MIVGQQKERRDTCGCEFVCDLHKTIGEDGKPTYSKTFREATHKCEAHIGIRASDLYETVREENGRKNRITMRISAWTQAPVQWRFDADRTLEVRGTMDDELKAAVNAQPGVRVVE